MADNIIRPSGAQGTRVDNYLRMYDQAKRIRSVMEPDYRMASAYCLPGQYNSWIGSDGPPVAQSGDAARRFQYDSTGVNCLPKYVAILNTMLTPQGSRWSKLTASDPLLMKSHAVRDWFDKLNNQLFDYRMDPIAKFIQANGEVYTSLGAYGTGPISITWGMNLNGRKTMKYKAWALRDVFILVNDEGDVTHIFRRFWLNSRQFKLKFPGAALPRSFANEAVASEENYIEFLQILCYRDDYVADTIDLRRLRVRCDYICVKDKEPVGEESGYSSMPMNTPRVYTSAGNPYGYAPAFMALASMGGASQTKKTLMKQGHKSLDPPLLASDDGVLSGRVDIRPGRVTYGAVNSQGQPLVHALQTGSNFQVGKEILADERDDTKDSFFVKLFTILEERPQMSATQVVEEIGQKASLLAPTMGRLQSEHAGPMIEREVDILTEQGLREDMPPELLEAQGQYTIRYTSPLAKALYNEDVAGFMRWVEFSLNYAEATQSKDSLYRINMDAAQPEVAEYMNVPTRWVRSDPEVKALKDADEKRMKEQQIVDQAPAIASVANAAMKRDGTSNAAGVSN